MTFIKKILNYTYRPLLQKYLAYDRKYHYKDISVVIKKGVFHPGFFFSTKFLMEEIRNLPLQGKTFLELGCGSGLIAVIGAKQGASVTASDINPEAVLCTKENALRNGVQIETIQSDIFLNLPAQKFDYIIINPPYYRGAPLNYEAMSWYCGEQMEYFDKLFKQLPCFIQDHSLTLMVLSEDCELETIKEMADRANFKFTLRREKKFWMERNFIYEIEKQPDSPAWTT